MRDDWLELTAEYGYSVHIRISAINMVQPSQRKETQPLTLVWVGQGYTSVKEPCEYVMEWIKGKEKDV